MVSPFSLDALEAVVFFAPATHKFISHNFRSF